MCILQVVRGLTLLAIGSTALVLGACGGGGGDSDDGIPAAAGSTADVIVGDVVGWTRSVCKAAIAFRSSTSSFSDDINGLDLATPGAKRQVLDLYADFAAKLKKYRDTVGGLKTPKTSGGAESREIWLEELQVSITRNEFFVDRVKAVDETTFAEGYLELITDFRDEFSEQDLRGRLDELVPQYPAIQSLIDTVDNTEGCADAAFD